MVSSSPFLGLEKKEVSFGKSSIAHYSRFHLAVVIEMRAISDKAMARILENLDPKKMID